MNNNIYKIVLLGEYSAGKTSIAKRYCQDTFDEYSESTIGASYFPKILNEHNIKLDIWDTAGQERYRALCSIYYKNASAVIIIFDLTSKKSFLIALDWIDEIKNNSQENTLIILVGNKSDLINKRIILYEDVIEKINDIKYIEVSAKDNININEIFNTIISNISTLPKREGIIELHQLKNKKKSCCII